MTRRPQAVLVTGMSGAGRTTCLKMLEDLGYEAVDNLPVGLLARVFRPAGAGGPSDVAVGMDSRTRDFEPHRLLRELRALREGSGPAAGAAGPFLLFFDCEDAELQRRFSASRRRHPLADDLPVEEALGRERALMAPLREEADLVVDTTGLVPPDLRRLLAGHFGPGDGRGRLGIAVVSFSYKRGLPRDADLVLDVRFLRNPHYVDGLRPLTGLDPEVQGYVREDPDLEPFVERLQSLLAPLLPRYEAEGKSYLTIAFGCTGGQHRSVYLAERLTGWLRAQGREAGVRHRDIPGGGAPAEAR
jgi:RNase adapter protein RapZ